MRYCDIYDLTRELDAMAGDGDRLARAHSMRIWKARRRWGGFPTPENWAALCDAGETARVWFQEIKAQPTVASSTAAPAAELLTNQ